MSELIYIITESQVFRIASRRSLFLIDIDRTRIFHEKSSRCLPRHRIAFATYPEHYFIVHFTGFPASTVKRTSVKTGLVQNDWFNSRSTTTFLPHTTKRSRASRCFRLVAVRYTGCRGTSYRVQLSLNGTRPEFAWSLIVTAMPLCDQRAFLHSPTCTRICREPARFPAHCQK